MCKPFHRARPLALSFVCWLWLGCTTVTAGENPTSLLNAADALTLASTLPGIGPVKAGAIVAHRERHGPFPDIDALLAVRGIGAITLERIRAHLRGTADAPPAADAPERDIGRSASGEREQAARAAVQALIARALADADERRAP